MQNPVMLTLFCGFSLLTLFFACMVIIQRNPVRSVLFLVAAFLTSSVLWMLLEAEFLALILVLVYVGAVMTLFLFVVMMLNVTEESQGIKKLVYLPIGILIVAFFVGLLIKSLPGNLYHPIQTAVQTMSNTEWIGSVLYTDYLVAFEMAAALLLVAIIAAITLTHRQVIASKRQNILKQLLTQKSERLSIVSMNVEK